MTNGEWILRLNRQGWDEQAIADHLRLRLQTVRSVLKCHGLVRIKDQAGIRHWAAPEAVLGYSSGVG